MTPQKINEAVARKLGYKEAHGAFLEPYPSQRLIPNYCTSIAAAWEIVEFVELPMTMGNNCVVKCKEWYCYWWDNANNSEAKEHADTAPMAICLAFLKLEGK